LPSARLLGDLGGRAQEGGAGDDTCERKDAREAPLLRHLRTRYFLSSGTTHDRETAAGTKTFPAELRALHLKHRLWLGPGGHDGRLWRAQLPAALAYAFPGQSLDSSAWTSSSATSNG
jgi:enterochelin esterase-like enzyme